MPMAFDERTVSTVYQELKKLFLRPNQCDQIWQQLICPNLTHS